MIKNLDHIRNDSGLLPAFAFPGGYQILYLFEDGATCCPACANGENDLEVLEVDDPQWNLVDYFVNWEGPEEYCAVCGEVFYSEYGDPDNVLE